MPVGLPGVALALDLVAEAGALSEGVLVLTGGQFRVGLLQDGEDVEGSVKRGGVILFEQGLGLSGD